MRHPESYPDHFVEQAAKSGKEEEYKEPPHPHEIPLELVTSVSVD